jgi:hypothetical protein
MKTFDQLQSLVRSCTKAELDKVIELLGYPRVQQKAIKSLLSSIFRQKEPDATAIRTQFSNLLGKNHTQYFLRLFERLLTALVKINHQNHYLEDLAGEEISLLVLREMRLTASERVYSMIQKAEKEEKWHIAYRCVEYIERMCDSQLFCIEMFPKGFNSSDRRDLYWTHISAADQLSRLMNAINATKKIHDETDRRNRISEIKKSFSEVLCLKPESKDNRLMYFKALYQLSYRVADYFGCISVLKTLVEEYDERLPDLSPSEYSHYLKCHQFLASLYWLTKDDVRQKIQFERLRQFSERGNLLANEAYARYCLVRIDCASDGTDGQLNDLLKEMQKRLSKFLSRPSGELGLLIVSSLAQYHLKNENPTKAIRTLLPTLTQPIASAPDVLHKSCLLILLAAQCEAGHFDVLNSHIKSVEQKMSQISVVTEYERFHLNALTRLAGIYNSGRLEGLTELRLAILEYANLPENNMLSNYFDWISWIERIERAK